MYTRHSSLHAPLLLLGLALLFNLLLTDASVTLSTGTVPAASGAAGRMAPVTQGAAMDGFPRWSPSGREIAFMRDGQIMLADPGGKRVRPLTSQPDSWDADPVWRPDGKALAFVRLSTRDNQAQVMELPLTESPQAAAPRPLAKEAGPIGYLAWSPAGDALYYTTSDHIVRIALPSGRLEEVYRAPQGWELLSGGIAVTRDGKALLFGGGPRLERGVEYDLYRLPATGGRPERLTTRGGIMPDLNPTGQVVAYRNPRSDTGIYLLNLATQAVERVVPDEPRAMFFHPDFSPDGQQLLVSRLLLAAPPEQGRGGFTSNIYTYRLGGE